MEILTSRFGKVTLDKEDIIRFPAGLIGFTDCRQWVLLADRRNDAVAWLQCVDKPDVALALVSPRRFLPHYKLRVTRQELAPLELADFSSAKVLAVVGKTDRGLTLNLQAPLVINPDRRLGHQVLAQGELPLRHELESGKAVLRKSA